MKSPYIKPNSKTHIGNYVSYIATRDGVEQADSTQKFMETTERQKQIIKKLLSDYPDSKDLYEYQDYLDKPNRGNADELILRIAETHAELFGDRDSIIYQVELNGNLKYALYEFADKADDSLCNIQANDLLERILDSDGYYITFNYTHTLEEIYDIPWEQILHIHGEVGEDNLELGYPKGNFKPEKYTYDARGKGRGPYVETEIEEHINGIEDYYVRTAYTELIDKCKSFYKEMRIDLLKDFLDKNQCKIEEIIVYGHSCAIDFDYFSYLNKRYSNAYWKFYVRGAEQESNVQYLIMENSIKNPDIIKV